MAHDYHEEHDGHSTGDVTSAVIQNEPASDLSVTVHEHDERPPQTDDVHSPLATAEPAEVSEHTEDVSTEAHEDGGVEQGLPALEPAAASPEYAETNAIGDAEEGPVDEAEAPHADDTQDEHAEGVQDEHAEEVAEAKGDLADPDADAESADASGEYEDYGEYDDGEEYNAADGKEVIYIDDGALIVLGYLISTY